MGLLLAQRSREAKSYNDVTKVHCDAKVLTNSD